MFYKVVMNDEALLYNTLEIVNVTRQIRRSPFIEVVSQNMSDQNNHPPFL